MTNFHQALLDAESRWARHRDLLDHDPGYHLRGRAVDWLPRDEYAHHWRWLGHELAIARARVQGAPPPRLGADTDTANARWTAEDRALSFQEAQRLATAAWDEYVTYHRALAPEQHTPEIDEAFAATIDHLDEHVGYMASAALAGESELWEGTTALLDARPAGALYRDDGGEVTAAATYAHLARWMQLTRGRIDAYLASGAVPPFEGDVDAQNAAWAREDAGVPFAEARRQAFLERDRTVAQMRSIPIARLTARVIAVYGGNLWGHYEEHLGYMGALAEPPTVRP